MEKITVKEFNIFCSIRNRRKNNLLRFGQEFLNTYFPETTHSELFYCEDDVKSRRIIFNTYITFESNSQKKRIDSLLQSRTNKKQ